MRIAIVNDLRLACEVLCRAVRSAGHEVIWTAPDGVEAIERAARDRPDLILMDLIMPRLDGVEATRRIMADSPCPILVVTSSVSGNIGKVYEAMGHGALDAVDTPRIGPTGAVAGAAALLEKIDRLGRLVCGPAAGTVSRSRGSGRPPEPGAVDWPLVLIGASTGGPKVLAEILADLPGDLAAAVIVVQHVDAAFAPGLACWLRAQARLPVELVTPGCEPTPGRILVAQTNDHLVLGRDRRLRYAVEPRDQPYRPSVDVLFADAAAHWPCPGVGVLLTGMGRDGALGLAALRRAGWLTIAQDRASCIVWGMPRAAVELGAAARVLPPGEIAGAILARLGRTPAR